MKSSLHFSLHTINEGHEISYKYYLALLLTDSKTLFLRPGHEV